MKSLINQERGSPPRTPDLTPWGTRIVGHDPVSFTSPIRQQTPIAVLLLIGFALPFGLLGDLASCAWLPLPVFFVRFFWACNYLGIFLAALRFGLKIGLGAAALAGVFHLTTAMTACKQSLSQQGDLAAFAAVAVLGSLLTDRERRARNRQQQEPGRDQAGRSGIFPAEELHHGRIAPGLMQSVRTPLSAIESAAYMLEDSASSDESQRELVAIILKECQQLGVLVRSLEFAESRPPSYREIHLSSILDDIERLAKPLMEASAFSFRKQVEPDLQLICDSELVVQAAVNLLTNAVRIVESGDEVVLSGRIEKNNVVIGMFDRRVGVLGQLQIAVAPQAFTRVSPLPRAMRWMPEIRNE